MLDSAVRKIQEILQERRKLPGGQLDPAWVPFVAPTLAEYNRDSTYGTGMMGSKPDNAVKDKVVQFNMQQASGQALAESQKAVDRVEKKLVGSTAKLKADGSWEVTKTGSEAFKEYVKDKDELAGRGHRRAGDDRWEGKVLRVKEVRMGLAQDTTGRRKGKDLHSVTKLQPQRQ